MTTVRTTVTKTTTTVTVKGSSDLSHRRVEAGTPQVVTAKAQFKNDDKQKQNVPKTYADLLEEFRGTGKLWEDPTFPASSESTFHSTSSRNFREYQWKRPKEIVSNPKLFAGGASRFDVQQGALGDCWLLAVVASLSMYEPLFFNVVPDDQNFEEDYIGAFRFRFWRFGEWREVIVDDRLPTYRNKLVYMHSSEMNEFWSALLEKAYAKLCGNYESLAGGSQSEAMEDFTGGLCETIKLNVKERPADLCNQMSMFLSRSSLMGCAIESAKIEGVLSNGLITGHAYSVTGVDKVTLLTGEKVDIVRIRNPWGNDKEWNGKWSDKSPEWKTIMEEDNKRIFSDTSFTNDGEFWMDYNDFVENFTKLEVCHLGPESLDGDFNGKVRWEMSLENGEWIKNITAGGCRNFIETFAMNTQYRVKIIDPDDDDTENSGTVIVGIMQKDMRKRHLPFYVVGYVIYQLKDPKSGILDKAFFKYSSTVAKSPGFVNQREVCGRHKLAPGYYVIIPSTFNANEEAEFLLRIFTQKPNKTKELDVSNSRSGIAKHLTALDPSMNEEANKLKIAEIEKELEVMFKKISGPNEVINASQLKHILNKVLSKDMKCQVEFDFEVCRSMVALFDNNFTGRMEFSEFLDLMKNIRIWKSAFNEFDTDNSGTFNPSEFRNALNNVGLSVSNALFKVVSNRYSQPEEGVITFTDFVMAVIRLTNAFETMQLQPKNDKKQLLFSPEEFLQSFLYM